MWMCLKMSEFMIINRLLNMYHTIHSVRSLKKLMSTYWEIFRTGLRSKMDCFGKMITFLTISERVLNMSGFNRSVFCILLNLCKYDRVLNILQDAIMEEFWIFQDYKYARFLHIQELHKVLNNVLWQSSEYAWSNFIGF